MSDLIAARPDDELREMYDEAKDDLDEDTTESELVRELLKTGLRLRGRRLYEQVGLSDRLAAQLEAERRAGESEQEVLREVVGDGLETRRGDALDAIGAGEELRAAVEAEQEKGEEPDEAVRRLIRDGVAESRTTILYRIGSERTAVVSTVLLVVSVSSLSVSAYLTAPGTRLFWSGVAVGVVLLFASIITFLAVIVANIALARPLVSTALRGVRDAISQISD